MTKLHCAMELEPVDAGGNVDAKVTRVAVDAALRLDVPALAHELSNSAREATGRKFQYRTIAGIRT